MMTGTRTVFAIVAAAATLAPWAGALRAAEEPRGQALRETRGEVIEVGVAIDEEGTAWSSIVIASDAGGPPLPLRLAPVDALDGEAAAIEVGHRVRVRFFAASEPYDVQRLRDETTGRVLRLRCLHGEPLWSGPDDVGRDRGTERWRHGSGPGGRRGGR